MLFRSAIHYYDKSIENLTKCLKKKLGRDPSEPFPNEITNPENELYMFVFLGSALTEKSAALASMGKTSDAEKTLLNTLEVVKNTQNIKNGQRDGRQQELTCYIYLHQLYQRSNDQVNAKKQIDNAKKLIDDNPEDSGLRERFDAWMQD